MPKAFCAPPSNVAPRTQTPVSRSASQHQQISASSRRSVTPPLGPDTRSHRVYRCSRCGKPGHNVRACPIPATWYDQRCGHCGMSGHNIRNCPIRHRKKKGQSLAKDASGAVMKCRVCLGRGKLPCSKCAGRVIDPRVSNRHSEESHPQLVSTGILTDMQKRMAEAVRRRARILRAENNGASDSDDHFSVNSNHHANGNGSTHAVNDDVRLVGYIPEQNGSTNDNGHHKVDNNAPCPRCMGTGYLTCMACS